MTLLVTSGCMRPAGATGGPPGSVDVAVAVSSDDAFETLSTGVVNLTNTSVIANANNQIGFRFVFTGAKPHQGATITTAYLTVRSASSIASGQTVRFWCQDTDSTATFDDATAFDVSDPATRPKTAQSVDWITPPFTAEVDYDTPSLVAPVQAVVNRAGWDEASIVVIIHRPAGTVNVGFRTVDQGNPAVLHLAWT